MKTMPSSLKNVMDDAIKIINFMKSRNLKYRIFKLSFAEMRSLQVYVMFPFVNFNSIKYKLKIRIKSIIKNVYIVPNRFFSIIYTFKYNLVSKLDNLNFFLYFKSNLIV